MTHYVREIDVVVITKDSLHPCLSECFDSIEASAKHANIEVRLILVDKSSTNGTCEEAMSRWSLTPFIIEDDGNRATARQSGIEAVETELFVFIDSDVVLTESWFEHMISYFADPKVGAVWGATVATKQAQVDYLDAMATIYQTDPLTLSVRAGHKRGMTHDTMIRTVAVKGIKIPEELHVFEDHYIRQHIESEGFEWLPVKVPFCYHDMHDKVDSEVFDDAYYGRKMGAHSRGWLMKHFFLSIPKLLYLLLKTRNTTLVRSEYRKEKEITKAILRLAKERISR